MCQTFSAVIDRLGTVRLPRNPACHSHSFIFREHGVFNGEAEDDHHLRIEIPLTRTVDGCELPFEIKNTQTTLEKDANPELFSLLWNRNPSFDQFHRFVTSRLSFDYSAMQGKTISREGRREVDGPTWWRPSMTIALTQALADWVTGSLQITRTKKSDLLHVNHHPGTADPFAALPFRAVALPPGMWHHHSIVVGAFSHTIYAWLGASRCDLPVTNPKSIDYDSWDGIVCNEDIAKKPLEIGRWRRRGPEQQGVLSFDDRAYLGVCKQAGIHHTGHPVDTNLRIRLRYGRPYFVNQRSSAMMTYPATTTTAFRIWTRKSINDGVNDPVLSPFWE